MINLTGDHRPFGFGSFGPVFDPMSLFTIGSAVIGGAGSILGGISAKSQADAQAEALKREADNQRAQASQAAAQKYKEQQTLMGNQVAAAAASGGDASDPSVLDIQGDTAQQGYVQRGTIIANGENAARGLEASAANAKASGTSALVGGIFDAGTSLLSAKAKSYEQYGSKFMPAPSGDPADPYTSYYRKMFGVG